jgi:hypothetical protein
MCLRWSASAALLLRRKSFCERVRSPGAARLAICSPSVVEHAAIEQLFDERDVRPLRVRPRPCA